MLLTVPQVAGADELVSVSRTDNILRKIDPATGATLSSSVTITLPGETVAGANGLARHPQTGELYALVRLSGGFPPARQLVKLDPTTGIAISIGDTGDRFAGLAFDSSATLYAVTGDGAATPEALYILSLTDATATFVANLGNGGDGEAIAFNPSDGFLYHASGVDDDLNPDTRIFEMIDLGTMTVTNIPISGSGYSEVSALVFSTNSFLAGDILGPLLLDVSDAGVFGVMGTMDHVTKGLAFVPSPAQLSALDRWGAALLGIALVGVALGIRRSVQSGTAHE